MEFVKELLNNQFALCVPVVLVLVGAVLTFVFGFKKTAQPPFNKLSSGGGDVRKSGSKKRKSKEKVNDFTHSHLLEVK